MVHGITQLLRLKAEWVTMSHTLKAWNAMKHHEIETLCLWNYRGKRCWISCISWCAFYELRSNKVELWDITLTNYGWWLYMPFQHLEITALQTSIHPDAWQQSAHLSPRHSEGQSHEQSLSPPESIATSFQQDEQMIKLPINIHRG